MVKQFSREIGSPDAIILDAASEKTSKALRKYCSDIGTTLRYLEEGTSWANKAELFIGLIKDTVRKYMKESDWPLSFWGYCVQRRSRINNRFLSENPISLPTFVPSSIPSRNPIQSPSNNPSRLAPVVLYIDPSCDPIYVPSYVPSVNSSRAPS